MFSRILIYSLVFMILPAIYSVTKLVFCHKWMPVLWLIIFAIINSVLCYFGGASIYLSRVLFMNATWTILLIILVNLGNHINSHRKVDWNIGAVVVLCYILFFVISSISFGAAQRSANSISVNNVKSSVAPTMHKNETPVAITPNTVAYKVKRAMGDIPNSNLYELCYDGSSLRLQAQYYHGKPVYIVPIRFRGFWKYHHSHKIPGYFRINATSTSANPVFVRKPMHYNFSDYFNHNVERSISIAHPEYRPLSSQAQLEIDNNGHPYNVETMYKPGLFNNRPNFKHLHFAVEDTETGKTKFYSNGKKTPKWIDENITSDVAEKMLEYYGGYRHGILNRWLTQSNIEKPSENGPEDGVTTVFDRSGRIHYVSDYTSSSNSKSALAYASLNARTGHLTYYHTHGITDSDGAKHNADDDGQVRNEHYSSEMPVLYKIHGVPTWVMNITDNSGFQRGFYYVNAEDPSNNSYDSSNTSCLDDYKQSLVANNSKASNSNKLSTKHDSGTVSRCLINTFNHKAIIMLNGNHTLFTISTDDYPKAQMVKLGDKVTFNSKGSTATKFVDQNIK